MKVKPGIISTIKEKFDDLSRLMSSITRAWDGSASNYESTDAYCSASLIDVNAAAGKDEKAQSHCMLPVKDPGSDTYNFEGIQAAAGGRGITQVKKPDDVPQDDWDSAVKSAANTIISQYNENDKTAPDSVYEAAGKEPPKEDGGGEDMEDEENRAVGMGYIYGLVDQALWAMDDWPFMIDLYLDSGDMFAVAASNGKLYRYPVEFNEADETITLGESTEIPLTAESRSVEKTKTTVYREANGQWRWLSISCTAVLNRVGEIDTRALFDSIIKRAEDTGEYPYRTFYHCGEAMKYGQCDYMARDGYCFITSGVFDTEGPNGDLALAEIEARQADPEYWGESIAFVPTAAPELVAVADDIQILAFNEGVAREISNLPEGEAAALFTQSSTQEVNRMRDMIKNALEKLGISQERIGEFEEQVDATNRSITDDGLIAREAAEEAQQDVDTDGDEELGGEEEEVETQAPVELEIGDDVIDNVASVATERLLDPAGPLMAVLADLTQSVESLRETQEQANGLLDGRIAALEQTDEEKRERWLEDLPRKPKARLTYRPREAHAQEEPEEPANEKPKDFAAQASKTIENLGVGY